MGPYDPTQEGDDAYRYQLAYMAYALGLAQFHCTPAYRELYRDTIAKLIQKMMRWEVWGYWELTSRGSKVMDPELTKLGDGWIDPVMRQNVMYSGHQLMMVSLYEMLDRDGRYDAEGSLTFQFRPVLRGLGPEDFPYDHGKLAGSIFTEFERNKFMGCECEPNSIFVYCNQFPMLGFLHYDHVHGTDLATRSIPKFREAWMQRSSLFRRDPGAELPVFYLVKQDEIIDEKANTNKEAVTSVSWGSVMHAWARDYVETVYPRARDRTLRRMPDGRLGVQMAGHHEKYEAYQNNPGHHSVDPMMLGVHIFGTLALSAAEMGDQETLAGMLRYADTYMNPTWQSGGFHYPRNDDLSSDAYTTALVGNALLGAARLCPQNGFWEMYNNPWNDKELHQPQLCDISYPNVLVSEAFFDQDRAALVLTLQPGDKPTSAEAFSVHGLGLSQRHRIEIDDRPALEIGPDEPSVEAGDVQVAVDHGAATLKFIMDLREERRLIVRPVPN